MTVLVAVTEHDVCEVGIAPTFVREHPRIQLDTLRPDEVISDRPDDAVAAWAKELGVLYHVRRSIPQSTGVSPAKALAMDYFKALLLPWPETSVP